jgi:hypothetical protein
MSVNKKTSLTDTKEVDSKKALEEITDHSRVKFSWILNEQIRYKEASPHIFFYIDEEIVGYITYSKGKWVLDFIWNVNWCFWVENNQYQTLIKWVFWDQWKQKIKGLGTYMLEIFFTKYCIPWNNIRIIIDNEYVKNILNKLMESGIISWYQYTNKILWEVIVVV